jgi:hypothetical protein
VTDAELHKLADLVADRLLPLLADRAPRLVDAATLADVLGISRDTVYARADQLGAVRLGTGPRARLRFDPDRARQALEVVAPVAPVVQMPRRRKPRASSAPLLPIRGRDA